MGEGGCVLTDRPQLKVLAESFRDWGRDCWCDPGKDNTCGKRFGWQQGVAPSGYSDHKYTYSHIGYNLKVTDMQAAVGVAQHQEIAELHRGAPVATNFRYLKDGMKDLQEYFYSARGHARLRPELVRFSHRRGSARDDAHAQRRHQDG